MIVSLFHITVPPERATAFEASWSQRAGMVDHMAGYQGMEVLRDGGTPGHYVVVTRWDAQEHFDAWRNSPEFNAGHSRQPSGPGGPSPLAIEFFEVVPNAVVEGGHTH